MIDRVFEDIAADISQIYKRLSDIELVGIKGATGTVPVPNNQGEMLIANAVPDWSLLLHPAVAGYALVTSANSAAWDQTPQWTGEHSFSAGIEMNGASGANELTVPDNVAAAFELLDAGGLEYLSVQSLDTQPALIVNQGGDDIDFRVEGQNRGDCIVVEASADVVGIRSSNPSAAGVAGLHVPWVSGDTAQTMYVGSSNAANAMLALMGESYSNVGVVGQSSLNTGMQAQSSTGTALVANLTGAGTAIANFLDNGAAVLTIQDGGQADFAEYLRHLGDTDTYWRFQTDQADLYCGGVAMISAVEAASDYVNLFPSGGGSVGIGVSAPLTILDTRYSSTYTGDDWINNREGLVIGNNDTTAGNAAYLVLRATVADDGYWLRNQYVANNDVNLQVARFLSGAGNDNIRLHIDNNGDIGMGGVISPGAQLHIDQASTTATQPVLSLDQADLSEEFINFISTIGAGNPIDTAAIGTYYGKIRVAVNGTFKYIALYNS